MIIFIIMFLLNNICLKSYWMLNRVFLCHQSSFFLRLYNVKFNSDVYFGGLIEACKFMNKKIYFHFFSFDLKIDNYNSIINSLTL